MAKTMSDAVYYETIEQILVKMIVIRKNTWYLIPSIELMRNDGYEQKPEWERTQTQMTEQVMLKMIWKIEDRSYFLHYEMAIHISKRKEVWDYNKKASPSAKEEKEQ